MENCAKTTIMSENERRGNAAPRNEGSLSQSPIPFSAQRRLAPRSLELLEWTPPGLLDGCMRPTLACRAKAIAKIRSIGAVAKPGVYRISRIDQSGCPTPLMSSITIQNHVITTSEGVRRRTGQRQHQAPKLEVKR
jgi:hypothetical protein